MRTRTALVGLLVLAACATPRASAEEPPAEEEPAAEAVVQVETQTYGGGETTTTHKPYETTTTHATTTTTEKATTTTATTTPREVTTTTHAPTTTAAPTTTLATTTTVAPTTTGVTTTTVGQTTTTLPSHKVFVCKYVGRPGIDERLQTGDNPISVDTHSLANFVGIGSFFNDAQGRSIAIAFDIGQPEPSVSQCPPPSGGTTTTTAAPTTTTTQPGGGTTTTTTQPGGGTTTTTQPGTGTTTTTLPPRPSLFGVDDFATCLNGAPAISITFGVRPELNGQIGQLSIISLPNGLTVVSNQSLVFLSGGTTVIPYPAVAVGTTSATLNYNLAGEFATASVGPPPTNCAVTTTTGAPTSTTTTVLPTTTTGLTTTTGPTTTTTLPGTTTTTTGSTTTRPGQTTTTLPSTFTFGAATTVCVTEVPTIRITFVSPAQFPTLVGQTGTLTMAALNGTVVSTQPLVYAPGTTVSLLYPGTRVNADGTIADVPGWNLNAAGFWVRDPSDAFLREGIVLTYTLNPTATATVTYPPESSACANPDGPFPPGTPRPPAAPPAAPPSQPGLPATGSNVDLMAALALLSLGGGTLLLVGVRRRR